MVLYGKGAGNTDKAPPIQKPSTKTKQKWTQKENYKKYGHVIYTAFNPFLDLNDKHTSISPS